MSDPMPYGGTERSSGPLRGREPSTSWRPLLEGPPAVDAWRVVLELAEELAPPPYAGEEPVDPTLAAGMAGLALFFSYLDRALPVAGYGEPAERCADLAIGTLSASPLGADLFSGFPGIGWMVDHLDGAAEPSPAGDPPPGEASPAALEAPTGDEPHPLDDAVLQAVAPGGVLSHNYDLLIGFSGLGVYALEGGSRPSALRCAEAVVARLEELAAATRAGISWPTPPAIAARLLGEAPAGPCHNLGMGHGVPGVISLLAALIDAGCEPARCARLLGPAVGWLLEQRLPAGAGSVFPHWSGEGMEAAPSRLAWCYGDLGIACALLRAAACTDNASWREAAVDVARAASRRHGQETGVIDAGLCHGAAGAGHLFNRLYQATGDPSLGEAARRWFCDALERRRPGQPVGGFPALEVDDAGELRRRADPGLLTGAAGVALALLAAVSEIEPRWDRVLLVS